MLNITRYDPIADVFDDLFKGFLVQPVAANGAYPRRESSEQVRNARIDVTEQNGEYKVLAELPGVKKEDIKVQIEGDQVSISADIRSERDAKQGEPSVERVVHSERYYGRVARTFRLGVELDEARASAKFENGVLELTLPRKETQAAKQITIQ
jgi:HSP20 family protein